MTEEMPIDRHAVRVLLLDADGRVLLARFSDHGREWWYAPGGGLEDDELHKDAAKREVAEETGFELTDPGPWVWVREHVFRFEGRLIRQLERYFLASVPAFEARPVYLGAEEASVFRELRWWSLPELKNSVEEFAPADLPDLLHKLVEEGPPDLPTVVGV